MNVSTSYDRYWEGRKLFASMTSNVRGAVITELDPSSSAYEAGIRQGDVIEEINHQPVRSAEDADHLTEGKGGVGETLVKIWNSQTGSHYVAVQEGNG